MCETMVLTLVLAVGGIAVLFCLPLNQQLFACGAMIIVCTVVFVCLLEMMLLRKMLVKHAEKLLDTLDDYIMRCIKNQLRKIFVLPTAIGLFLILSFLMIIYIGNDKRIQSTEWMSFGCTVGFAVIICIYQMIVYRMSLKKLREILKL